MHDELQKLGADLVAISPQSIDKNAEVRQRHRLTFRVLSDSGNAYARQLGLVFTLPEDLRQVYLGAGISLPDHNGDDSWQLPLSTRIVVAAGGRIHRIDADPDYTRRPEPEETLAAIRSLR